ncbi:MAG: hypothetical protein OHK0012_07510 [Synechococcales cyanobacterium]
MTVIALSDGREAILNPGKGRHLYQAQRKAGKDNDRIPFYLLAELVVIADQPVTVEEIDEMPISDVLLLLGALEQDFPDTPLPARS